MQAVGRQTQRAPDGAPLRYGWHRPEQITLYLLVQQRRPTSSPKTAVPLVDHAIPHVRVCPCWTLPCSRPTTVPAVPSR